MSQTAVFEREAKNQKIAEENTNKAAARDSIIAEVQNECWLAIEISMHEAAPIRLQSLRAKYKRGNSFQRQKETASPDVQIMNPGEDIAEAQNVDALGGNGALGPPPPPPPAFESPFDVPALAEGSGLEGTTGAEVSVRPSATEYACPLFVDATPTMTKAADTAAALVNYYLGQPGGIIAPPRPTLLAKSKDDKPSHTGLVKYSRLTFGEEWAGGIDFAALNKAGTFVSNGIEGAKSLDPMDRGAPVCEVINYLRIAHDEFEVEHRDHGNITPIHFQFVENGWRFANLNGAQWDRMILGTNKSPLQLIECIRWFLGSDVRKSAYPRLKAPFDETKLMDDGDPVLQPTSFKFGGHPFVSAPNLVVMVDACLAGPIAKTAFEQGGDGEAIIIAELGEEVVLGVEPSKRGLWGTDITKVAILVPATSESLAVKTISILSALPEPKLYKLPSSGVSSKIMWAEEAEVARARRGLELVASSGGGGAQVKELRESLDAFVQESKDAMARSQESQERLEKIVENQATHAVEMQEKNVELQGNLAGLMASQGQASATQHASAEAASHQIAELSGMLANFMRGTDRVVDRLASAVNIEELPPLDAEMAAARDKRPLEDEWYAILTLLHSIPTCTPLIPQFTLLAHVQFAIRAVATRVDWHVMLAPPGLTPSGAPPTAPHPLPQSLVLDVASVSTSTLHAVHFDVEPPTVLLPPEPPPKEIDRLGPFSCFWNSISTVPHATPQRLACHAVLASDWWMWHLASRPPRTCRSHATAACTVVPADLRAFYTCGGGSRPFALDLLRLESIFVVYHRYSSCLVVLHLFTRAYFIAALLPPRRGRSGSPLATFPILIWPKVPKFSSNP